MASNAATYTVTVNGRAVTVESAGYSATARTVTLALPTTALHTGDTVIVMWRNLRDAGGATVIGQAGPLLAR